jgi:hypothetical protein
MQRLDRADATLVTSLESLTNMKNHLASTTKTVVDGFNEHAKTLAEIKNGLGSQTTTLVALEARLRTHSGLLDQLSRTSEAQNARLDDVVARVDSTAATLRDEVDEVRVRLIPDIRSKVKTMDGILHAALARLDASQNDTPPSTTAATNGTSSASDDRKPATNNTEDGAHGDPADGYTATDGTSSGLAAKNAAPGAPSTPAATHNVCFDTAQDICHGQATQSSFGDSRFGPTRSFTSPSRSDDSWYRPGNRVPNVTPGSYGHTFDDGPHYDHLRGQRPPRLSTSHGDPTLGGSFQSSNVCQKPFNLEGVDFNVDSLDEINLRSV